MEMFQASLLKTGKETLPLYGLIVHQEMIYWFLHNTQLDNRTLLVEPFKVDSVFFVGNLTLNTDDSKLKKMFESHGRVERAFVMKNLVRRSKGYGFVEYSLKSQQQSHYYQPSTYQNSVYQQATPTYSLQPPTSYQQPVAATSTYSQQPLASYQQPVMADGCYQQQQPPLYQVFQVYDTNKRPRH